MKGVGGSRLSGQGLGGFTGGSFGGLGFGGLGSCGCLFILMAPGKMLLAVPGLLPYSRNPANFDRPFLLAHVS